MAKSLFCTLALAALLPSACITVEPGPTPPSPGPSDPVTLSWRLQGKSFDGELGAVASGYWADIYLSVNETEHPIDRHEEPFIEHAIAKNKPGTLSTYRIIGEDGAWTEYSVRREGGGLVVFVDGQSANEGMPSAPPTHSARIKTIPLP